MKKCTRKGFMKGVAAGFFIAANRIYGQSVACGDQKLRFLKVATGGMGNNDLKIMLGTGKTICVGLCDVAPSQMESWRAQMPGVPVSTDWREALAKTKDAIDAVVISTPDHSHACIALAAMRLGKHVYVQKPVAHTFEECEKLMESAKKYGVVTQMGTQYHPGADRYVKLVDAGFYGEVLDVQGWTDRPCVHWRQGMTELPKEDPLPEEGFNWDCWLGPAKWRPYSNAYQPLRFRAWPDLGCGTIGDMAIHNLDPAFAALGIRLPETINTWADAPASVAYAKHEMVDWHFGPTAKCPHGLDVHWYQSSLRPKPVPGADKRLPIGLNGIIMSGTKLTTIGGGWSSREKGPAVYALTGRAFDQAALREANREMSELFKEVPDPKPWRRHHYLEWVDACRAGRPQDCACRMEYACPMTQAGILGAIALRWPGEELHFDPVAKKFKEEKANAFLAQEERAGFECIV